MNSLRRYVASTTLKETPWDAAVLRGDVAAEIAKLKAEPGKSILKYGVTRLDRTLLEHGLIDEFRFSVIPKIVGKGTRLFERVDAHMLTLTLTSSKVFANGVAMLV